MAVEEGDQADNPARQRKGPKRGHPVWGPGYREWWKVERLFFGRNNSGGGSPS